LTAINYDISNFTRVVVPSTYLDFRDFAYSKFIGNFNIIFEPQYVGCSTIFTYSTLSIVDFYGYLILITEHSGKDMSVLIG